MTVAVTGATGFVGRAVVARLQAAGTPVLALGRVPAGPPGAAYVRWDLGTGEPAPRSLRDCEAVVHAAAHVAGWGAERTFQSVTVGGTGRLLDGLDPGTRLVVVGSSSVYVPDGRPDAYRERDGPLPLDRYRAAYPRAKAAQDALVTARRPDAIVLRPRAIWGPGDRTLLPRLEARVRFGVLVLPAGGRHPMSVTHIETIVDAIEAALRRRTVSGPVNVADATPRAPADLVRALFAARGRPLRVLSLPARLGFGAAGVVEAMWGLAGLRGEPPVTRYAVAALASPGVMDLTRLHDELGIRPDVDLERGIRGIAA